MPDPSVTTWARLEPRTRSADPNPGLEARIHDALWLLFRQWQFGEFVGTDAGSPVVARARLSTAPLSRVRLRAAPPVAYDGTAPLEAVVEAEAADLSVIKAAAFAGQRFVQVLRDAGFATYADRVSSQFQLPTATDPATALDPVATQFALVLASRAPDGNRLASELRAALHPASGPSHLPTALAIDPGDVATVTQLAEGWLAWVDAEWPPATMAAWAPERLEYQFEVGAEVSGGEVVFTSPEYDGDGIEWYEFDQSAEPALGAANQGSVRSIVQSVLPGQLTFPGAPARRFWQFEDAAVDLGSISAAADDLGRLLVTEFALTFGSDWYLLPVDLLAGSYTTVQSLVVDNTFGDHLLIQPTSQAFTKGGLWRAFTISGGAADPASPGLLLTPGLPSHVEGSDLEQVWLVRDDMAEMAWAIEAIVEGPSGYPRSRRDEAPPTEAGTAAATTADLIYRLETKVPVYWIPIVPVQVGGRVMLQRGAMLRYDVHGTGTRIEPLGRLLAAGATMLLREEEVPRTGRRLARLPLMSRWIGGSLHDWTVRRSGVGRGQGSSGLAFDLAIPNVGASPQ